MEAPVAVEAPVEYKILAKDSQREVLKRRATELAAASRGKDSLLFLDRGARPIAYLYMKVFAQLYPGEKRPNIGFINLGSEKGRPIDNATYRGEPYPTTTEDFSRLFGQENIQELTEYLTQKKDEKRLIVDDIEDSGATRKIAETLLPAVDPSNNYEQFTFIENPADRVRFSEADDFPDIPLEWYDEPIHPATPWHRQASLVSDVDRNSFFTKPNPNPEERTAGIALRAELDKLASEIPIQTPVLAQ